MVSEKQIKNGMKDEGKEHPWMSEKMRKQLVLDHVTLHPYMYRK